MTELHEQNWHALCAGVRAGTISPAQAATECAARPFFTQCAYDAALVRRGRPPSRYWSEWLAAFERLATARPDVTL